MQRPIPCYKQSTSDRCAIAALRMVLAYWNREYTEDELARLCDTVESGPVHQRGTTTIGIARGASARGFNVQFWCESSTQEVLGDIEEIALVPQAQMWLDAAIQIADEHQAWQMLKATVEESKPVIVSIDTQQLGQVEGGPHSVVVIDAGKESVTVNDAESSTQPTEISKDSFITAWRQVFYIAVLITPRGA